MGTNVIKYFSQHWISELSFCGMTFHWPAGKGLQISPQGYKHQQLKNWNILFNLILSIKSINVLFSRHISSGNMPAFKSLQWQWLYWLFKLKKPNFFK